MKFNLRGTKSNSFKYVIGNEQFGYEPNSKLQSSFELEELFKFPIILI